MFSRNGALWIGAAMLALGVSAGCGSGGSGAPQIYVTQANASRYSSEALMLAARATTGAWIKVADAEEIQNDLDRIRSRYPILRLIDVPPDYLLTEVVVGLKLDCPWRAAWNARTVNTGDPRVDLALRSYNAIDVLPGLTLPDRQIFNIRLAQPLRIPACATELKDASAFFVSVGESDRTGDGDRLALERSGSTKTYTFSHGWSDCASYCIFRHNWAVTLKPDNTMSIEESGDDLSTDPGWPR